MTEQPSGMTSPKFPIWLRPDGIVPQVWETGVAIGLDDAIMAGAATGTLGGGRRRPLLVDVHASGPLDRAARIEFASHVDLVSAPR